MVGRRLFSNLEPYTKTDKRWADWQQAWTRSIILCFRNGGGWITWDWSKKIHEVLLEHGEASYTVQHFEEECDILSTMRHSNIVQFLGVHFSEGERLPLGPMLVMEFLPMNLTSCTERRGILPEEISYSILHDIALGLYYLHNQSQTCPIVHSHLQVLPAGSSNTKLYYDLNLLDTV